MKKLLFILFLFSIQFVEAQTIQPRPNPPKAVNDFGNFLEPFQEEALERKIRDYNDSTSSAIIIITVPELQGYDIAEMALKYMREWKPGIADRDNGVIILVSKAERKARIETGYGMEGVLPDITAKHIIDEVLVPNFKANDYYRGFDQAVDAIILAAAGEYKATAKKKSKGGGGGAFKTIFIVILVIVFLLSGAGGGGRGGNYMSRRGSRGMDSGLPWFIIGSLLGGGGRGGGGGGFGGGGGGFGGFGGGSGGGGGASGGW